MTRRGVQRHNDDWREISGAGTMAVRDVSVCVLYTFSGRILLQHRTNDAFRLPGYWAFFGGGIEKGGTPMEALIREIREELSYQVQNPNFLLAQKVRDGETDNT